MHDELEALARTLINVLSTSTADERIPAEDLRKVLLFIDDVTSVLDNAFSNIVVILTPFVTLDESDLLNEKRHALAQDLQLLQTRTYYRDVGNICDQLRELCKNYERTVAPIVTHLEKGNEWTSLFWLLEEREGRVVRLVGNAVGEIAAHLYDYTGYPGFSFVAMSEPGQNYVTPGSASLLSIRQLAFDFRQRLIDLLRDVQRIKNEILGLSGRTGFLELINTDRYKLHENVVQLTHTNNVDIHLGNRYDISGGNQGAVGDGAEARDYTSTSFPDPPSSITAP